MRLCILTLSLFLSACASTMNGGPWHTRITATPAISQVVITDVRTQKPVFKGHTPVGIALERGAGYFKAGWYQIEISNNGYYSQVFTIKGRLDGWYFGNIFAGGLIGMLLVDPLTGDMYRFPNYIHADLEPRD